MAPGQVDRQDQAQARAKRGVVAGYDDLLEAKITPKGYAEHALSLVEGETAGVVRALVEGRRINAAQRVAMALFLYLQKHRTPRGRQWLTYAFEQTYTLNTMRRLLNPREVRELHRLRGEEISLEEAERLGREWVDQLDSGELVLRAGQDHAVGAMFMFAEGAVPAIAGQMSWLVLHAPPDIDFIVPDHPILLHDSTTLSGLGVGLVVVPGDRGNMPARPNGSARCGSRPA
jgi:uncharacterized protein DUF4238